MTNAIVLQQLIQTLRTGEIEEIEVAEVILVGHGYDALTAIKQQAKYGNADYLILTGYTQQYTRAQDLLTRLTLLETMPARRSCATDL